MEFHWMPSQRLALQVQQAQLQPADNAQLLDKVEIRAIAAPMEWTSFPISSPFSLDYTPRQTKTRGRNYDRDTTFRQSVVFTAKSQRVVWLEQIDWRMKFSLPVCVEDCRCLLGYDLLLTRGYLLERYIA